MYAPKDLCKNKVKDNIVNWKENIKKIYGVYILILEGEYCIFVV